MGLETGDTIASLNASWPLGSDPRSEGDDHLRLLKRVLQSDVVALSGARMTGTLHVGDIDDAINGRSGVRLLPMGFLEVQRDTSNTNSAIRLIHGTQGVFAVYGNGDVKNKNNSYGGFSDARLKENIVDAGPELEDLLKLRVVHFNLIGDNLRQLGLIAQEVEQIKPGLVEDDPDTGMKSLKYSVLVPILVKAVQELAARVAALEAAG